MNHATMNHADFQKWLAHCGALQTIELAQCLDDLCDGLMVSANSGFSDHHGLIYKLRCLSLEIDFYPLSDFEGIDGAYAFYLMPERQCDTARLIHEALLLDIVDKMQGDGSDHV